MGLMTSGDSLVSRDGQLANHADCCCDIWCTTGGIEPEAGPLVVVISGVGTGIDCDGSDYCGHIYNRTLTESDFETCSAGPSCTSLGVGAGCSKLWGWEPADVSSCTFANRCAGLTIAPLLSDGNYIASFGLTHSGTGSARWVKYYGSTPPALPITFGPADLDCDISMSCDMSGATISVAVA